MTCQTTRFHLNVCAAITAATLTAGTIASAGGTDAMLTRHWDAKNAALPADAAAAAKLYAGDGVLADALGTLHGAPVAGRPDIEAFFMAFADRYQAIIHKEDRRCVSEGLAFWEGRIEGTAIDGTAFTMPVVFASTFDADGMVVEERIYATKPAK